MSSSMPSGRSLVATAGALALVLSSSIASSQAADRSGYAADLGAKGEKDKVDKKECVAAYEDGQRLRRESKLESARERLLACAQDGCPAVVRRDCTTWVTEIEQSIPTVIVQAVDGDGHDLFDARVSLDGKAVAARLDGKPIPVDPGPHVVRFVRDGMPPVEEKFVAREGEKNRRISGRFGEPTTAKSVGAVDEGPRRAKVPASVYVFGGVSAVGFATFAYFGALGLSAKGDLDDAGCKPNCTSSGIDRARRRFIVADVGLGVGVVSLGVATALFLTRGYVEKPAATTTASSLRFDVGPTLGGASAGLSGAF